VSVSAKHYLKQAAKYTKLVKENLLKAAKRHAAQQKKHSTL
jgi:hypothetical protein